MRIRAFTPGDFETVRALWRATEGMGVGPGDSAEAVAAFLERNADLSFVAVDDGVIVASVLCGHDGRRGYIYRLAVAPTHRRRGLGVELARRCLTGLKAAGIERCQVFVQADNEPAKRFWEALGGKLRGDLDMFSIAVGAEVPATRGGCLETDRLILRMLREDDFEGYAQMAGDPEVARYLGDGKPLSRDDAWRSLAFHLGHWALRGYGMWAVEEKATGLFVGRVGHFYPEGWPDFEIGWSLARAHWGKGYATEAAGRALEHAFTELDRAHVVSLIHPENAASIKVAERLGERLERKVDLKGAEVLVYGITRKA